MNTQLLLIDDDPVIQMLLKEFFDSHELSLIHAGTFQEGIQLIPSTSPALLLLDYQLPDSNGTDSLLYLREHFPHIPVLTITANERASHLDNQAKVQANAYLTKPFDFPQLLHCVQELIGGTLSGSSLNNCTE